MIKPKILYRARLTSMPAYKGKKKGGRKRVSKCNIPDNQEETQELAIDVVPGPCAHVGVLGRLKINQLRRRLVDKGLRRAKEGQTAVGGIGESRD